MLSVTVVSGLLRRCRFPRNDGCTLNENSAMTGCSINDVGSRPNLQVFLPTDSNTAQPASDFAAALEPKK